MVSLPIEPIKVAQVYSKLPLHCAVLQYFEVPERTKGLLIDLSEAVRHRGPIILEPHGREMFGHNGNVPVATVRPTNALMNLHRAVLDVIRTVPGSVVCDPDWADDGYRPHVSDTKENSLVSQRMVDNVVLLRKYPAMKYAVGGISLGLARPGRC